ncbi:MAG: Na(+)-translocating NADH-quinone reductase subunit C [Thermodesulfovibrionia bacterium]|nr:Na(+)-translocating NADH-quinone reductase subunit C [Thermodesulfovibrionia bacterium]
MPDDSVKKTLVVALAVCIVCSILVSTAAVSLHGIQKENKRLDKVKNILLAGDLFVEGGDIQSLYEENITPVMIELSSGETVPEEKFTKELNITDFDIKKIAGDPAYSMMIPPDKDRAKITKMPKFMVIYLVKKDNEIEKIVLSIYGKGLWSTLYGFIALDRDLKTVKGFTFYEHAETPGLGGEIDNPRWKNSWKEKQAFDEEGNVKIKVIKGKVDTLRPEAIHQIDGISGATLTARGVDDLVNFWLGNDGYGPFLNRFKEELHG